MQQTKDMHQHILTIDESENTAISYHKSDVSSNYMHKPDLKELVDIFINCNNDIFQYDTTNAIILIKDDNTEISLHQYKSNDNIVFIKITDNNLATVDSDILLSTEYINDDCLPAVHIWQELPPLMWKHETLAINDNELKKLMIKTIDGYNTCLNTRYGNTYKFNNVPEAIDACMKNTYTYNGIVYQGFLPSLYQLTIFLNHFGILKYILNYIGYTKNMITHMLKYMNTGQEKICMKFWSSTSVEDGQDAFNKAYTYNTCLDYTELFKESRLFVFPIFKKLPANKC